MTNIYDMFATDTLREAEGFWHPVSDTIQFLMARAGGSNSNFAKSLEVRTRPHRRKIDNDDMDLDLANKIMIEVFAETVIKDWEGITNEDGEPMPYTKENAVMLLTQLPDLFNELREVAVKQANFRSANLEDAVGN